MKKMLRKKVLQLVFFYDIYLSIFCIIIFLLCMEKIVNKVLKLSFFADRFGIEKARLSWGILVAQNEDCETSLSPVVLIKDSNLFVNIFNDSLEPLLNIAGCQSTTYVAKKKIISGERYLFAGDYKVKIKEEEIERVYRTKIFSSELEKEASFLN